MDESLAELVDRIGPFPDGAVSMVGSGPGDPGLISVKGAVRLCQADVIAQGGAYCPPQLWRLCRAGACRVDTGRRSEGTQMPLDQLVEMIRGHVAAGRRVVRLKGGDPFVFEHGEEEVRALANAGVEFEIVPGPTSGIAAAAYAGVLISDAEYSDAISLATGKPSRRAGVRDPDFAAMARTGTLAVYLAEENIEAFSRQLMAGGLPGRTPAAIVERGTQPGQRVITADVASIGEAARTNNVAKPATLYVGEAVRWVDRLNWFERRPLFGKRIINTRPAAQAAALTGLLGAAGAEVIEIPAVEVGPLDDYAAVDASIGRMDEFDWLVLTSVNGVDALFSRLAGLGLDARALASVRIAAIGPATAGRLRARSIEPDLVPEEFVAEAVASSMAAAGLEDQRCLLLRSQRARRALAEQLCAAGAACLEVPAYVTRCPNTLSPEIEAELKSGRIDMITFTSSSTFTNFMEMLGDSAVDVFRRVSLSSIGPITTSAICAAGYEPAVQAEKYTSAGLARAIVKHYRRSG